MSVSARGLGPGLVGVRGRLVGLVAAIVLVLVLGAAVDAGRALASGPCGTGGVEAVSASTASCTYSSVGDDTFAVPAGVGEASFTVDGAVGGADESGDTPGGPGGQVTATIGSLSSGQVFSISVGGPGASLGGGTATNGGGAGSGGSLGGGAGGGGGYSSVTDTSTSTLELLAGGGGGAGGGGAGNNAPGAEGGVGGTSSGSGAVTNGGTAGSVTSSASAGSVVLGGGGGGTAGAGGGAGGTAGAVTGAAPSGCDVLPSLSGRDGSSSGQGGTGGAVGGGGGGGGGGGYVGGGGGASGGGEECNTQPGIFASGGGGGGGGSSFADPALAATLSDGVNAGAGWVKVSWSVVATSTSASAPGSEPMNTAIPASVISSTLTGATSPTGTITFTVFGPQQNPPTDCTSGGTQVGTPVSVSGDGTYNPSAGFTPVSAGDYFWYASYSGDTNNGSSNSGCGAAMAETTVPAPSVSSDTGPANGVYAPGQTLDFTVTFNGGVLVTSGGTPTAELALQMASGTKEALYDPGASDPSAGTLVFTYTIAPGDYAPAGLVVGPNITPLNGSTITDPTGAVGVNTALATTEFPGLLIENGLAISNSAPTSVVSGKQLKYTIVASNAAAQAASGVTVSDALPADVHFVSASTTKGTCAPASKGGTVACKVGTLLGGSSATITIVVIATRPETLKDTASVTATGITPEADNNATATTTVHG